MSVYNSSSHRSVQSENRREEGASAEPERAISHCLCSETPEKAGIASDLRETSALRRYTSQQQQPPW